jgi:ParB-like chromosome segregation protein Spo0J
MLPVAELRTESLVRIRPVDATHVAALAEVPDRWPPIVVASRTMTVLDGIHRVAAARQLGMTSITAHLFEGDDDAAFVEAVRQNVEQGLPLSLAERRRAAGRLLMSAPDRSDRVIGEICGLDHKTVARLRDECGRPTGDVPRSDVRVGRDRRTRPVDVVGLRGRIADALADAPDDSLRQIARRVGASPETVRDVRARLTRGEDPVPEGMRAAHAAGPVPIPRPMPAPTWSADTACKSEPESAAFAAWFDRGAESVDWRSFVEAVPLSRAYEIADQARAFAGSWQAFAQALDRRARSEAAAVQ